MSIPRLVVRGVDNQCVGLLVERVQGPERLPVMEVPFKLLRDAQVAVGKLEDLGDAFLIRTAAAVVLLLKGQRIFAAGLRRIQVMHSRKLHRIVPWMVVDVAFAVPEMEQEWLPLVLDGMERGGLRLSSSQKVTVRLLKSTSRIER
jgi:hypothetical protein